MAAAGVMGIYEYVILQHKNNAALVNNEVVNKEEQIE